MTSLEQSIFEKVREYFYLQEEYETKWYAYAEMRASLIQKYSTDEDLTGELKTLFSLEQMLESLKKKKQSAWEEIEKIIHSDERYASVLAKFEKEESELGIKIGGAEIDYSDALRELNIKKEKEKRENQKIAELRKERRKNEQTISKLEEKNKEIDNQIEAIVNKSTEEYAEESKEKLNAYLNAISKLEFTREAKKENLSDIFNEIFDEHLEDESSEVSLIYSQNRLTSENIKETKEQIETTTSSIDEKLCKKDEVFNILLTEANKVTTKFQEEKIKAKEAAQEALIMSGSSGKVKLGYQKVMVELGE